MNADPVHQDSSEISLSAKVVVIVVVGSRFSLEFIERVEQLIFFLVCPGQLQGIFAWTSYRLG